MYYLHGKQHRVNGPANIVYYESGKIDHEEFWFDDVNLTPEGFLHETYIDKLPNQVLREQAVQLAEAAGWEITAEKLNTAVGLTVETATIIKLNSSAKTSSRKRYNRGVKPVKLREK